MFWHSKISIVNLDQLHTAVQGAPRFVTGQLQDRAKDIVTTNIAAPSVEEVPQNQKPVWVEQRVFNSGNPIHVQALAVYEELRRLNGRRMSRKTCQLLGRVAGITAQIAELSNKGQSEGISDAEMTQLTQHLSDYHQVSRALRKNPVLKFLGFLAVGLISLAILAVSGALLASSLGLIAFVPPAIVAVIGPTTAALKTAGSIAVGSVGVAVGAGVGLAAGSMFSRMLRTQAVRREMHGFETAVIMAKPAMTVNKQ
jgi:hypothetical protein